MNTQRVNPIVFVVGCPRSGTTLLQRMLDSHSLLAVANDTHFIPRALHKSAPQSVEQAIAGRDIPLDESLIDGLLTYHRFERIGIEQSIARSLAATSTTYAGWIERIYTDFAARGGKPYAGEKTPDYVRHLPLLHGLFPSAKVLHIVRDGRDVALSTLDWAATGKGPGRWEIWQHDPIAACALWWRWQVSSGRADSERLDSSSYAEVSYENLVRDPAVQLRWISAFLGLPYEESMVQFHSGKTTSIAGKSAKSNWLPATPGLRDWTAQMKPADQALFQCIAGPTLGAFKLPATEHPITPQIRKRAAASIDWWNRFVTRRKIKAQRRLEVRLEQSI